MTKTNTTNNYKLNDLMELLQDAKSNYTYWKNCYEEEERDAVKEFSLLKMEIIMNEIVYIKQLILNSVNF